MICKFCDGHGKTSYIRGLKPVNCVPCFGTGFLGHERNTEINNYFNGKTEKLRKE